MHKNREIEVNL